MKNNKSNKTKALIIDEGIVFAITSLQLNIIGKLIDTKVREYIIRYIDSYKGCPPTTDALYQFVTTVVLDSTIKTLSFLDDTLKDNEVEEAIVKGIRYGIPSPKK